MKGLNSLIKLAIEEDLGKGDITTNSVIPKDKKATAVIIAKESGVIAGLDIAKTVFKKFDRKIVFKKLVKEGAKVKAGKKIARVKGNARAILSAERIVLNLLSRLSGIATLTNRFVEKVKPYKAKILDTRKTTPGWRYLEKYAVKMGGAKNHRMGLYDMVLIKDNHLKLNKDIKDVVKKTKKTRKRIEIEVKNLKQLKKALETDADWIMLDNMSLKDIKKTVKLIKNKKIEVSGGVSLDNVVSIAKTGVDYISVGMITHSAKALNISMNVR